MSERTKAVVRAAERLAMAMDLRMERDALDGEFLAHNAIEVDDLRKEAREAAAELVRALAIPLSGLELVGEKTIDCSGYDLAELHLMLYDDKDRKLGNPFGELHSMSVLLDRWEVSRKMRLSVELTPRASPRADGLPRERP